jgi:hypothetical protein
MIKNKNPRQKAVKITMSLIREKQKPCQVDILSTQTITHPLYYKTIPYFCKNYKMDVKRQIPKNECHAPKLRRGKSPPSRQSHTAIPLSPSPSRLIELHHRIRKKTKKEEQYHQGAQRNTKGRIPQLHSFFVRRCGTFFALVVKSLAAV